MTNYNDGKWHGWNGGKRPVHPETVVEYVWNGPATVVANEACAGDGVCWEASGDLRIIAFRVVRKYSAPREFWIDLKPFGDAPVVSLTPMGGSYIHVREVIE